MDKTIKLLKIKNYEIIGSFSDKKIKYPLDIDLQEVNINSKPENLLKLFRKKYKIARKDKNIFIMDFKSGKYKGTPLRWTEATIKQGYQMIDDVKINFIDTLRQNETIKLDIIAIINKRFHEFSINYYFGEIPDKMEIENIFLLEFQTKMKKKEFFKAMKRLYSYSKLTKNDKLKNDLLTFLNGKTGALNYSINNLLLISEIINNTYRKPSKSDIIYNLTLIKKDLPREYRCIVDSIMGISNIEDMVSPINEVIKLLTNKVNDNVLCFIKDKINFSQI